ncbi:hypothetical protein HNP38_002021 [Chryseobacterium defluvii]|uniref:EndoU nuclease-like protein n=1 Tax=Chryseobacterium defluvii TaxID=160396 RepID=A0A840KDT8_9FLAO|nr:EndoU domain-containing protein [Chryseobacterium defluvii]MBB4806725.1 hypothetical protein [Chryseobacterium defluvii]
MKKYFNLSGDELIRSNPIPVNPLDRNSLKQYNSSASFKEIAFENRFGESSKCNPENLGKFYHGQLLIDDLIEDIYKNRNNPKFFFNFGNYAVNHGFNLNSQNPSMISTVLKNAYNDFSKSVKYQYITHEGAKKNADLEVYLNLMPCHVDLNQPGFVFTLNPSSEAIEYRAYYVYADYLDLRNFGKDNRDYDLNSKYNAITLFTKNGEDFLAITNDDDKWYVKKRITEIFVSELKQASTPRELKFLYENMPFFVQNVLLEHLDQKLLWEHFLALSFYKEGNLFSSDEKASGAVIVLLKAFNNIQLIYEKFKENQTLVKDIYNNLEGESTINGQIFSNKIAFATFITALCVHHKMNGLRKIEKTFSYGDYNGISSRNTPRKEKENEFFLQKMKDIPPLGMDFLPFRAFDDTIPDMDDGAFYHPLDMVLLIDANSEEKYPDIAAAILVKAIADEKEKLEREKLISLGLSLLGLVIGAAGLSSGNPLILAGAIADIALNTANATTIVFDKDILQLKGGREFLDEWGRFYLTANIILTVPVAGELLVKGIRLINLARKAGKPGVVNYVKSCMVKIILDKNILTFRGNTLSESQAVVRIIDGEEVIKATSFYFNKINIERLYERGVVIVETTAAGKTEFALIYKGEPILQGAASEIAYRRGMKGLALNLYKPFKLIAKLEELYRARIFSKYADKFDNGLFHHMDGEFNTSLLEEIMPSGYIYRDEFLVSQGGHRGSAIPGGNIRLERIIEPDGIFSIFRLPDDIPFKAKISVRYRDGYLLKKAESSMFPKNWDIKRIREEIAYVYDNTVAKNVGQLPSKPNDLFNKYEHFSNDGSFKILIEVDDTGQIMNSYPNL